MKTFQDFQESAWQRKEGKNKSGGLNEKGRKSYERENPGSDLKAPQPEGGSRKKSFCARMGGMKKKLTSSKTANDPDSRINKSLRKWKCNEDLTGDLKTDAERYRVPRGPGGNPKRIGDKVRSMKSTQPLGQLKVKYGADKVREYYKKNKAVGESAVLDANKKLENQAWRKKKQKEYAKLIAIYNHQKQLQQQGLGSPTKRKKTSESFEIDKSAHKKVQRQAKIRNLAKDNKNPNEKAAAERKLKGPKLAWEEFKKHI